MKQIPTITRLWLGPSFGFLILIIEIPIAYGLASRAPQGAVSVAALGAAISVLVPINCLVLALGSTATAWVTGARSFARLRHFSLALGVLCSTAMLTVALTPFGEWVVGSLLGVPAETGVLVREALLILAFSSPAVALRRCCQGTLIRVGATKRIAISSVVRLFSTITLASAAVKLTPWPGYIVGAVALTVGGWMETLTLSLLSSRRLLPLPQDAAEAPSWRALLHFHLPVGGKTIIDYLYLPLITAAISRSPSPALSLIAWPVLYALLCIVESPSRELEPITLSVERGTPVVGSPARFALGLGIVLSALWLVLAFSPGALSRVFVGFGLSGAALGVALAAQIWASLVPLLSALRNWKRGRWLSTRPPSFVALSAAGSVVGASLMVVALRAWFPDGVVLGAAAMTLLVGLDLLILSVAKPFSKSI